MAFRHGKPYDRPQANTTGQRYFTAACGPSRPTRYFDPESKDRNDRQFSLDQPAVNIALGQHSVEDNTSRSVYSNISLGSLHDQVESVDSNRIKIKVSHGNNRKIKKPKRKDMVTLNNLSVSKLTSTEGVEFLQKLSNETKVKVKVIPQGKTKKFEYACVLEGSKQAKPIVMRAIKTYCHGLLKDAKLQEAESFDLTDSFRGEEFDMKVLKESLSKLENPNVNWVKQAFYLHKKVKTNWGKYNAAIKCGPSHKSTELEDLLRRQYIALHAVLFGKLDIEDASLHLAVVKQALKNGLVKESDQEVVRNSYNYIFLSTKRLNISYHIAIKELPPHLSLKTEIDDLLRSASSICEKNKMKTEFGKLQVAYSNLINCHYSERKIFQFRKMYDIIKEKDQK